MFHKLHLFPAGILSSVRRAAAAASLCFALFPLSAGAKEEVDTVSPYVIETGKRIEGLAVIEPTAHRGESTIAVAHGEAGAAIYDYRGELLWFDEEPALLISYYAGNLLIYRKHNEPGGRVDRYSYSPGRAPVFLATAIPAAPAATTIQRTAYAMLGPLRIEGNLIKLEGVGAITAEEPVSAVAAARFFTPIIAGKTLLYATESGRIYIEPLAAAIGEGSARPND